MVPETADSGRSWRNRGQDYFRTGEARLYKTLDKLEAVIQHNEADIRTWEPHEYELNLTYANDIVAGTPYLAQLREAIRDDTKQKIAEAQK